MAETAYIQAINDGDGNMVCPVTTSDAVYFVSQSESGTVTQKTLTKTIEDMKTSFQDGVDTIVAKLKSLGVTPTASTPAAIAAAIETMYNNRYSSGYSAGQNSVTVSCSISGRTATAKTSTGKTATASVALGTSNGTLTATLTPTGNNTATKTYAEGYYYAGTVTAAGGTAYTAGQNSVTVSCSMSGRTATAKTSTGKTATASAALGTNNGNLTATLTPTGNNTATKAYAAGWYEAGTVTAAGGTAYAAGKMGASLSVSLDSYMRNTVTYDTKYGYFSATAQMVKLNLTLKNGVLTLSSRQRIYAKDGDDHEVFEEFPSSSTFNTTTYNIS